VSEQDINPAFLFVNVRIMRLHPVESMPQSAVLTDSLEKLEKYLFEQKVESKIISPIRELLRELKKKL